MSAETVAERPLTLVVNPSAGHGRARTVLARAQEILDHERREFRVAATRSLDHGVELALEAVESGELPVVVSGDGLIGAVGGALAGSGQPMGLVPAGRGNDLARGLGIPVDPAGAVRVLLAGNVRSIDVGEANGKRFLGIASVGFDSVANEIANRTRILKGSPVYAWAAVRALIGWKPVRFTLAGDGETTRFTGYTVALANNGFYGGGMNLAPEADISDGKLDLVTIGDTGRLRFLANFPRVFRGTHVDRSDLFQTRQVRSLEVSASRPLTVFADGDPLTTLPARFRLLPGALDLLVPGADS